MEIHSLIIKEKKLPVCDKFLRRLFAQIQLHVTQSEIGLGKGVISDEAIAKYLKNKRTGLAVQNPDLYSRYRKLGLSAATIDRAQRGEKGGVKSNVKFELLDFLCFVAVEQSLLECIFNPEYVSESALYFVNIPPYAERDLAHHLGHQNIAIERVSTLNIREDEPWSQSELLVGADYITEKFWNLHTSVAERARYYTRIDSNVIKDAVATPGFIVEPHELYQVKDEDDEYVEKTFNDVLSQSLLDRFSLIAILGDGGVGKSTFLYWLTKQYYSHFDIIFIQTISDSLTKSIVRCYTTPRIHAKPLIVIIDNAAKYWTQILDLVERIKNNRTRKLEIIFIIAERTSRFYSHSDTVNELEKKFSGRRQYIYYNPVSKEKVFEKIFEILTREKGITTNIKQNAKSFFLDPNINSICVSTFKLLSYLKLKNEIDYKFDWDEWDDFITTHPEFNSLKNLYIAVASLYQFGIMLPITTECKSLQTNQVEIVRAISVFGSETPILLSEEIKDGMLRMSLKLKHEDVANWFLSNERRNKQALAFFDDFLSHVNSADSARVLRKLRKSLRSMEFSGSPFVNYLNDSRYKHLLEQCLQIRSMSLLDTTKIKMEYGLLLKTTNREQAKILFKEIADNNIENNFSRDQLAQIYIEEVDYNSAYEKYSEILKNKDGLYAFAKLYYLLRLATSSDVFLPIDTNHLNEKIVVVWNSLNNNEKHAILNELILSKEFKIAEELLETVEIPIPATAKCWIRLGKEIEYTNETIDKKKKCFVNGISLYKKMNDTRLSYVYDYALFLYRTCRFPESTEFLKRVTANMSDQNRSKIYDGYWHRVRVTKKLFFPDLPDKSNFIEMNNYLQNKCVIASALVSYNQKNVNNIIKGYHILQTVRHHAKNYFPEVYLTATKQIAYCYSANADRGWNGSNAYDNRVLAEWYYDELLTKNLPFTNSEYSSMLKNLLDFRDKEKSRKVLSLLNRKFFAQDRKRKTSKFYRFRGRANVDLLQYKDAWRDYKISMRHCRIDFYTIKKDFNNDRAYLLNNMAELIYTCTIEGLKLPGASISNALNYINEAISIKPDWDIPKELKDKIISL